MPHAINPKGTWGPRGRGFSMGLLQPEGQVLHFTGQVAWDESEQIVGPGDVEAQTHQCFRNIGAVLAAVGGGYDDLVAITTYFTDRGQLPIIQQVRGHYLGHETAPVSTSVMVAGLGHPEFLVELTPIAVIPHDRLKQIDPG